MRVEGKKYPENTIAKEIQSEEEKTAKAELETVC